MCSVEEGERAEGREVRRDAEGGGGGDWIRPPSAGSGQAQNGVFADAGMTGMCPVRKARAERSER